MEEKRIGCTLITPLFSFGANRNVPELRTAELKGAMRNLYRIVCPADTKTLKTDEAELFGSAAGSGGLSGHASPIRLLIHGNLKYRKEDLLLHRTKKPEILPCFPEGHFQIRSCLNQAIVRKNSQLSQTADLEWYEDLIKLSLILCGMGRRSRKGRGCFEIDNLKFDNKYQMQEWLCEGLNKIASTSSSGFVQVYKIDKQRIVTTVDCSAKRPVIQKIIIGRKIDKEQIRTYLLAIDITCHKLKECKLGLNEKITGNIKGEKKFASPLLLRVVKTNEGYYPLYIFIKGVYDKEMIDPDCSQREKFIQELEKIQGGEARR